jgi:hypothetical protein
MGARGRWSQENEIRESTTVWGLNLIGFISSRSAGGVYSMSSPYLVTKRTRLLNFIEQACGQALLLDADGASVFIEIGKLPSTPTLQSILAAVAAAAADPRIAQGADLKTGDEAKEELADGDASGPQEDEWKTSEEEVAANSSDTQGGQSGAQSGDHWKSLGVFGHCDFRAAHTA